MSEKRPDLSQIPAQPGVYLMKDKSGSLLYVGKAINLRNRVRSYFQPSADHTPRIGVMVSLVDHVEFIVTGNEIEALILENNLIKKEKPRYNVMLRDDKTYPYLKLTNEKFPRLVVVRKVLKDGAQYFGPYVSGKAVRIARGLIHRIFPIRLSKDVLDTALPRRPCLNFQMKKCLAPCAGKVTPEEYGEMVERIAKLLKGRDRELLGELEKRMHGAAAHHQFELAAHLRDQMFAIRELHEKQNIDAAAGHMDEDHIAVLCAGGAGIVRILMVRGGRLAGDQNFTFKKADDPGELCAAFIQQFYNAAFAVPAELVVNVLPDDAAVIALWLSELKGKKVVITLPERGRKKQLIEMALENARFTLESFMQGEESIKEALREIRDTVGMEQWPATMQAIDISNTGGVAAVGSLVAFHNGMPDKKEYKRFRITTPGPDDYAMVAEVVRRRFKRLRAEGLPCPDLLLIDGGPGQVAAAAEAIAPFQPGQVLIGIAKGEDRNNPETDRIFLAGRKEPLPFPAKSAGKFMLQRLRDEAHRFAIQYHRKTRQKAAFHHAIEDLAGIGPKRKKMLIAAFGSLKGAKEASVEEIRKALAISEKLAREIHEKL